MFFLTTKHHLGDLLKLEMWFDCIGPSPDWQLSNLFSNTCYHYHYYRFCRDITVYDMQQYTKWYFNVKRRLAVIKGDSYVELEPTKTDSPYKIKFGGQYHTWCLWRSEENFTYVKRLTVLLSTILMIFALVLILQGVPSFQFRDGFDYYRYDIDVFTVLTAFVSSFLVFLLHLMLVWCFRYHLSLLIIRNQSLIFQVVKN